jgi:hypothetical protein
MVGFIAFYSHSARDYRQYSAIAIIHTLQFTVPHTLGSSVFRQGIYNNLNISSNHTRSLLCAAKSPFLPLFCNCQLQRLDSIQFLCPQTRRLTLHFRLDYPLYSTTTVLYSVASSVSFYNASARTTQKTASSVGKACLLVRCQAMDVLPLHAYA